MLAMGLGLVAWTGADVARADVSCERPTEVTASLDVGEVSALVVRGVHAPVRIVAGEGPIRLVATTCAPDDAKLKLKRSGPAAVATLRGATDASLEVFVPAALVAVTVEGLQGSLEVEGVPTRMAVVSTTGPVAVRGVHSLRAGYVEGPLAASDIAGNVAVDAHTGDVSASQVGGDVTIDQVVGAVSVDGVDGALSVRRNTGPVAQNGVRGAVDVE